MKFTYNPRIIRHLGTELITSDEIAITELIKNSYDAKATKVNLQYFSSIDDMDENTLEFTLSPKIKSELAEYAKADILMLEDNGSGMSATTLKTSFFEIGTSSKRDAKEKQNDNDDIILGDKGIGRLSAQRLSPTLILETTSIEDKRISIIRINWDDFLTSLETEAPETYAVKKAEISYTRLWFIGTKDEPINWSSFFEEKDISPKDIFGKTIKKQSAWFISDDLQSALSFLYSPFEKQRTNLNIKARINQIEARLDFNYDTLKIAESVHAFESEIVYDDDGKAIDLAISMKMVIKPWFIERIHQSEIGKVLYQDWRLSHTGYAKLLKKYDKKYSVSLSETLLLSDLIAKWNLSEKDLGRILKMSPIEGKIYSFKRDALLMKTAINSAIENGFIHENSSIASDIKTFLNTNNGIKLYRNRFRIGTIGNKDNDWLKLQQKRTSGQQFYRFELGNVIGYIKLNDPRQKFISETSSRETMTSSPYAAALQNVLNQLLDIFSPGFTKKAVEITKDILDIEKLIPKNDADELKDQVNRSNEILIAANANIKAIQKAFLVIDQNFDLDTDEKIDAVKRVLGGLKDISINFEQNISDTQRAFQSANKLILIAESEQKRIEVEAYNNYKLMANGLVTEVITHELHSLLSGSSEKNDNEEHFKALKDYLFEVEAFAMNKQHLSPLKKKFDAQYLKLGDLNRFYSFLEKTFLYKGNSHDFERVEVSGYLNELQPRFDFRLRRNKITLDFTNVHQSWVVPKGSLMHVFYNLIDNSIYWIQERQRREKYDETYKNKSQDSITIEGIGEDTIQFYDSGTGILPPYEHTLFNSLESGKENGRGMGLYIVRNFLKSFGASIDLLEARNEYGNRYIFEIKIKNKEFDDVE